MTPEKDKVNLCYYNIEPGDLVLNSKLNPKNRHVAGSGMLVFQWESMNTLNVLDLT